MGQENQLLVSRAATLALNRTGSGVDWGAGASRSTNKVGNAMSNFCAECGARLTANAQFCSECGSPVGGNLSHARPSAGSRLHVAAANAPKSIGSRIAKNAWATVGISFAVICAGIAMAMLRPFGQAVADAQNRSLLEKSLRDEAVEVNKGLPMMLSSDTRIDEVHAGPGLVATYRLTVINLPAPGQAAPALDTNVLTANVAKLVCSTPDLQPYLDTDVNVVFDYHDKNGGNLAQVNVPLRKCATLGTAAP